MCHLKSKTTSDVPLLVRHASAVWMLLSGVLSLCTQAIEVEAFFDPEEIIWGNTTVYKLSITGATKAEPKGQLSEVAGLDLIGQSQEARINGIDSKTQSPRAEKILFFKNEGATTWALYDCPPIRFRFKARPKPYLKTRSMSKPPVCCCRHCQTAALDRL